MTQVPSSPSADAPHYGDLLRAVEGLRNWRAIVLSIIYLGVALLITYLGGKLAFSAGSPVLALLFTLLAAVVAYLGVSAVGLTLMDQAQGLPSRPLLLAVWDSLSAALRVFVVALIGAVIILVFYALLALVLFICKIPALGPLLYAVTFPVLVIVGGLLLFSIGVALTMIGPAIWNGASIRGAVAMLWQIATRRTVELLIRLVLLSLLSGLVSWILFAILGCGFFSVGGFSAAILDLSISFDAFNLLNVLGGNTYNFASVSDTVNYMKAAAFGSSVLLVLVISAVNAMVLLGLNLIYLKLSADLDPSETERLIGQRLAEARAKAQSIKEESQRRLEEAKEIRRQQQEAATAQAHAAAEAKAQAEAARNAAPAASVAKAVTSATSQPAVNLCPKCQAPIVPGDLFCGECGQKLG
ncbi:hypothetical protein FACS1894185_1320 [Betaproteobacteria bacterium]|nr:hypothetical protein FACS1894185_1320 [Betaproteobacteria bacterium]